MSKRKKPRLTAQQPRVVYELISGSTHVNIEVQTKRELTDDLQRVTRLTAQQASHAAYVLHTLQANITAPTWRCRRVGLLKFEPVEPQKSQPEPEEPEPISPAW